MARDTTGFDNVDAVADLIAGDEIWVGAGGIRTGTTDSPGGQNGQVVPVAAMQALTDAGAVNLTTYCTTLTTTGAAAVTLADATYEGHTKKVKMIVDVGDATLTFNGTATIVFADVGDYAILVWNGADWIPVELGNEADGATAPVYTPA